MATYKIVNGQFVKDTSQQQTQPNNNPTTNVSRQFNGGVSNVTHGTSGQATGNISTPSYQYNASTGSSTIPQGYPGAVSQSVQTKTTNTISYSPFTVVPKEGFKTIQQLVGELNIQASNGSITQSDYDKRFQQIQTYAKQTTDAFGQQPQILTPNPKQFANIGENTSQISPILTQQQTYLQPRNGYITAKTIQQKEIILPGTIYQPTLPEQLNQTGQNIVNVSKQYISSVKNAAIDRPYALGVASKKEALQLTNKNELGANLIVVPVLAKNIALGVGSGLLTVATHPQQTFTGLVEEAATQPARLGGELFVNLAALEGLKTGYEGVKYATTPKIIPGSQLMVGEETRVGTGTDFVIKGQGMTQQLEITPLNKFLGKLPEIEAKDISYEFQVKNMYSAEPGTFNIKPIGSPYTLQGQIPESSFSDLLKYQKETLEGLTTREGFNVKGYVSVEGNPIVTGDLIDVYGKTPSVRVSYSDLPGLKDKFFTYDTKVAVVDSEGLLRGSVKGLQLEGGTGVFTQEITTPGKAAFIQGVTIEGETSTSISFDFKPIQIKGVSTGSSNVLKSIYGTTTTGQQIVLPSAEITPSLTSTSSAILKTNVSPVVGKVVNDVYGLTVATKPANLSNLVYAGSAVNAFIEAETYNQSKYGLVPSFVPNTNTITGGQVKTSQLISPMQNVKISAVTMPKTVQIQSTGLGIKTSTLTSPRTITSEQTKISVSEATNVDVATSIRTKTLQQQKQLLQFRTPTTFRGAMINITPKILKPSPIPFPTNPTSRGFSPRLINYRQNKSFNVVSRVRGKQKLLALGVPQNIALSIGRSFTGNTTARSFTIKPVGFTTQQDIGGINLFQYRQPKVGGKVHREGFTFVEKSKFAIDTFGEKRGLLNAKRLRVKTKLFK